MTWPAIMFCVRMQSPCRGRGAGASLCGQSLQSTPCGQAARMRALPRPQMQCRRKTTSLHQVSTAGSQMWHVKDEAAVGRVHALLWRRMQCRRA